MAIKALQKLNVQYSVQLKIVVSVGADKIKNLMIKEFGNMPEWVELLPPREDIATYYRNSDVFLQVAREEGFCYALVEVAYCEVPCISSKIDGVPNEIPGVDLFNSEDVDCLARACKENIIHPKNHDALLVAKKYVEEKYGIKKWVNDMYNHYCHFIQ